MNKKKYFITTESEDDGEGNWLMSYADLMTLLFGFFVIIASFSTPDSRKIEKMRKASSESLGVEYKNSFNQLSEQLSELLMKKNLSQHVLLENLEDGLELIVKSKTFFESGSAKLSPEAHLFLKDVASVLTSTGKQYKIIIEGHTDDQKINTARFPSNWELSLYRASAVVKLFEDIGFPHKRLRPLGLADTEPLVDISKISNQELLSEARRKNRRIVIRVKKYLSK